MPWLGCFGVCDRSTIRYFYEEKLGPVDQVVAALELLGMCDLQNNGRRNYCNDERWDMNVLAETRWVS